LPLTAPGIK